MSMQKAKTKPTRSQRRSNRVSTQASMPIPNSGATASSVFRVLNSLSAPRLNQFFPDTYFSWSKTVIDSQITGAVTSSNTFRVNSPAAGFGPQVNWTGAFPNNVPAGIAYLLGSDQVTGSSAPYQYLAVLEVEHQIDFYNNSTVGAYVSLVPAQSASLSGVSTTNLAEQRGASQVMLPPSNTSMPFRMRLDYKLDAAFGVSYEELSNNIGYKEFATGNPTLGYYNHVVVTAVDGTTTCNMQCRHTFFLRIKFSNINTFTTTTPT